MNLTITNGINSLDKRHNSKLKHPLSMPEQSKDNVQESGQNKSVNKYMHNSGSFTGKNETAAKVLNKGLFRNEKFGKFLEFIDEHNVTGTALIALIFAGLLRPATIMSLPGEKDRDDKIYASSHSLASGLMGFIFSLILTNPLDKAIKKVFEKGTAGSEKFDSLNKDINDLQKQLYDESLLRLKNSGDLTPSQYENIVSKLNSCLENNEELVKAREKASEPVDDMLSKIFEEEKISDKFQKAKKTFNELGNEEKFKADMVKFRNLTGKKMALNTLIKNLPDWLIAIPRAALTIALIPPILKYVFGLEKKKPAAKVEEQPKVEVQSQPSQQDEQIEEVKIIFNRPVFEEFNKGGQQ
jgi:hypothetical protein